MKQQRDEDPMADGDYTARQADLAAKHMLFDVQSLRPSLQFPPTTDLTVPLQNLQRRAVNIFQRGGEIVERHHLEDPTRVFYNASLKQMSTEEVARVAADFRRQPLAFPARGGPVRLETMERLVSGVRQCISWIRSAVKTRPYAVIIERRSDGRIRSSAWLAGELGRSFRPPVGVVIMETRGVSAAKVLSSGLHMAYTLGARTFVHIDDFIGTGVQKTELLAAVRPWFERHSTCRLLVAAAFGTAEGTRKVREEVDRKRGHRVRTMYMTARQTIFPHKVPDAVTLGVEAENYLDIHLDLHTRKTPYQFETLL